MSTNKKHPSLNETFCENLEFFLQLKGWNKAELGRRLSVSRTQIGRITDPTISPTLETVEKVAVALEVPPHFLIFMDLKDDALALQKYLNPEVDGDTFDSMLTALSTFRKSKDLIKSLDPKKK